MRRFILLVLVSFFYSVSVLAGPCDTTISGTTTSTLNCEDDDDLIVSGSITYDGQNAVHAQQHQDVTITNTGTIQATGHSAIKGQSALSLEITNSGTIYSENDYGIKLIEAEKITITNEAGGIIKTDPSATDDLIAIGGTKIGNCGTCVDESTTSSGEGLTLQNYGTIDSYQQTLYGGKNSAHSSKKTKIYNYDGATIDATNIYAIRFDYAEDFTLNNYSGATIQTENSYGAVSVLSGETVAIDNEGTITAANKWGVYCYYCEDVTLTNSGTITATVRTVDLGEITGTNTFTNSGTITGTADTSNVGAVNLLKATGVTLTNSGTISSESQYAIDAENAYSPTIINSGTISSSTTLNNGNAIELSQSGSGTAGSGATITNSGTIKAPGGTGGTGIRIGSGSIPYNDVTITNSGTISGTNDSIYVQESDTTGTNIITKEEATYTGEINMGSAVVEMTLDCSIKKDMDIEIHSKTNMTVTNNLCGNDTYEILDSSKNADADNSETNGYLRVLGEDLEIAQNNPKYRSENVLTKFKGLFDASNYINWHAPEDKFFKIFHSTQKREGTYKGTMSGVVGQLSPFILGDIRNNFFVGYTHQGGDFDNGEFLGGDNFALGLKSVYENNGFKASFTPMVGVNDLTITDYDTDTKTSISTNLFSEFAGINTKLGKDIELSEEGSLNLSFQSTLGLQRFPEYLSKFSDGDLSVDEAIEQVLGLGFEVKYIDEFAEGFVVQPYAGININNNLNNSIKITADGENKNVSPASSSTTGYFVGLSIIKNLDEDLNFDFQLSYSNEDGLINEVASVSLVKYFGDKPKNQIPTSDVRDIRKKPDLKKIDKNLTAQNDNKEEKLNVIIKKTIQENLISKHLIKELIKEVERLTLTNKIFKNKIIENETRGFKNKIFEIDYTEIDKPVLIGFLLIMAFASYGFLIFIASAYKKIIFKLAN